MSDSTNRREFLATGAVAFTGMNTALKPVAAPAAPAPKILNYNPNMEYRRLGKTGLMVSSVCLGGHWKRVGVMMNQPGFKGEGYLDQDFKNLSNADFIRNRSEVVTKAIELGMNYVDACSPQEILAYSKVLQGRRDKMYFGFSWHTREPRYEEWRSANKLIEGLNMSLKEANLDYVDVWRISMPMEGISDMGTLLQIEHASVEAMEMARKQGKARFTGVSSHNRVWLKSLIEEYGKTIQVVLFPYTAASKQLPDDSVFEAIKKNDIGVFGIKPFADNSLFAGTSAPNHPQAVEDDKRARLAIRYILENPAITAPIAGLINTHQVENVAQAIAERKKNAKLTTKERAELELATKNLWAQLRPSHSWLKDWAAV